MAIVVFQSGYLLLYTKVSDMVAKVKSSVMTVVEFHSVSVEIQ